MSAQTLHRRGEKFVHAMGPWLYGIPAYLVVFAFLLWSLGRLASWIFAVPDLTK